MHTSTKVTKTVVITGGNSGLGYECARFIARAPEWHVIIASRNAAKSARAAQALRDRTANPHIESRSLDLASLASVRQFAAALVASDTPPLHALICNAGVQHISGDYWTDDGYEMTFGVNHLGHFLLTHLLLPHLESPARIVFVSSGTHDPERKTLMPPPVYTTARELAFPQSRPDLTPQEAQKLGMQRYSTSKLCNVLCVYELARQLYAAGYNTPPNLITVNAFDPGLMPGTGLARDYTPLMKLLWSTLLRLLVPFIGNANTITQSGEALARLILDPDMEAVTGKYFGCKGEMPTSKASYDVTTARDLWNTSLELTGVSAADTILPL